MELLQREVHKAETDSSAAVRRVRYTAKADDIRHVCRAILEAAKQVPSDTTLNRVRIDEGNRRSSHEVQNLMVPLAFMDALLTLDAWETREEGATISGAEILLEDNASGNHLSLSFYNNERPEARGLEPDVLLVYCGTPPRSDKEPTIPAAFQHESVQHVLLHLLGTVALRDLPHVPTAYMEE